MKGERSVRVTIFKENYDEYGYHLEGNICVMNHPKNTDSIDLHRVKCVRIWSFSGQHFPTLGLNTKIYRVFTDNFKVEVLNMFEYPQLLAE